MLSHEKAMLLVENIFVVIHCEWSNCFVLSLYLCLGHYHYHSFCCLCCDLDWDHIVMNGCMHCCFCHLDFAVGSFSLACWSTICFLGWCHFLDMLLKCVLVFHEHDICIVQMKHGLWCCWCHHIYFASLITFVAILLFSTFCFLWMSRRWFFIASIASLWSVFTLCWLDKLLHRNPCSSCNVSWWH